MATIRHVSSSVSKIIRSAQIVPTFEKAVQELCENAIDAQAKDIRIDVYPSSGKIVVSDDGTGFENLCDVGKSSHTSKGERSGRYIGFRGQALSAISQMSTLHIFTRTRGSDNERSEVGSLRKTIKNGKTLFQGHAQYERPSPGTTVTVEGLFWNVSVRRKRLHSRNLAGILKNLKEFMTSYAIVHVDISFALYVSGQRKALDVRTSHNKGGNTILSRVSYFFGTELAKGLEYVEADLPPFRVSGYLGTECVNSSSRVIFFVNGRFAKLIELTKLFRGERRNRQVDAAGSTKSTGSYPLAVLTIDVFSTSATLYDATVESSRRLRACVRCLLERRRRSKPRLEREKSTSERSSTRCRPFGEPRAQLRRGEPLVTGDLAFARSEKRKNLPVSRRAVIENSLLTFRSVADISRAWTNPALKPKRNAVAIASIQDMKFVRRTRIRLDTSRLGDARVVGCANRQFILATCQAADASTRLLLCFDQHAAHERVRVERFQSEFSQQAEKGTVGQKHWRPPRTLHVASADARQFQTNRSFLSRLGFRFAIEIRNPAKRLAKVIMTKSPAILGTAVDIAGMLETSKWLSGRDGAISSSTLPPPIARILESKACRGAIMFGDSITADRAQCLIRELSECRLPFQCAHGRPSVKILAALESPNEDNGG